MATSGIPERALFVNQVRAAVDTKGPFYSDVRCDRGTKRYLLRMATKRTKRAPKAKPADPRLSSIKFKSITKADDAIMVELCRLTREQTYSKALLAAARGYVRQGQELEALQAKYDTLAEVGAMIIKAKRRKSSAEIELEELYSKLDHLPREVQLTHIKSGSFAMAFDDQDEEDDTDEVPPHIEVIDPMNRAENRARRRAERRGMSRRTR